MKQAKVLTKAELKRVLTLAAAASRAPPNQGAILQNQGNVSTKICQMTMTAAPNIVSLIGATVHWQDPLALY